MRRQRWRRQKVQLLHGHVDVARNGIASAFCTNLGIGEWSLCHDTPCLVTEYSLLPVYVMKR